MPQGLGWWLSQWSTCVGRIKTWAPVPKLMTKAGLSDMCSWVCKSSNNEGGNEDRQIDPRKLTGQLVWLAHTRKVLSGTKGAYMSIYSQRPDCLLCFLVFPRRGCREDIVNSAKPARSLHIGNGAAGSASMRGHGTCSHYSRTESAMLSLPPKWIQVYKIKLLICNIVIQEIKFLTWALSTSCYI